MSTKGRRTKRQEGPATGRNGQLRLLASPARGQARGRWVLDENTRRIGRAGVAAVRETLRQAQPPEPAEPYRRAS